MEQNLPVMAKKVWRLMRVMFFMLKKGISKTKFFSDLNLMVKHGKFAGKSLQNLLFHHHHNWAAATFHHQAHHLPSRHEYQFSCTNTPPYPLSLFSTHKKHQNNHHRVATNTPPPVDDIDEMIDPAVMKKVLDMLASATVSPALPGFGMSPMAVKQLRITDSPFPLSNGDDDGQVDEAAEKFIMRFYNDLRMQN